MAYKNIILTICIHLAVIILLSFAGGYTYFSAHNIPLTIILSLLIFIEITAVINFFNRTNNNLAYFFESIENDDTQLHFSTQIASKSQKRLHESLNRVNQLIGKIKLENERNEQYYHALIQQSATGLIAMDACHKIKIMNNKACEFAGIGVARNFHRIEKRNPQFWNILCNIKPGETQTYKDIREGNIFYLSMTATEIRFHAEYYKLISILDIKHELEAKEVESWQKLISILTHEIMNSIAPITSLSTTLKKFFKKEDIPLPPNELTIETINNTIQGLEIIEERGAGLINFVSNYRKLAKIPNPVFSKFNLSEWLCNLRMLFHERLTDEKIQLEMHINPRLHVTGDIKLLNQVLINIINNAVDALAGINDAKIKIEAEQRTGKQIQLCISNNGPSIPPEIIDKIFVPFFSTKESGSGIGLSLSRQIVHMHKGYIYAESNETETRFVIVL